MGQALAIIMQLGGWSLSSRGPEAPPKMKDQSFLFA